MTLALAALRIFFSALTAALYATPLEFSSIAPGSTGRLRSSQCVALVTFLNSTTLARQFLPRGRCSSLAFNLMPTASRSSWIHSNVSRMLTACTSGCRRAKYLSLASRLSHSRCSSSVSVTRSRVSGYIPSFAPCEAIGNDPSFSATRPTLAMSCNASSIY